MTGGDEPQALVTYELVEVFGEVRVAAHSESQRCNMREGGLGFGVCNKCVISI